MPIQTDKLKTLFLSGTDDSTEASVEDGMQRTYWLQRHVINEGARLNEIKECFPFLFQKKHML